MIMGKYYKVQYLPNSGYGFCRRNSLKTYGDDIVESVVRDQFALLFGSKINCFRRLYENTYF